MVNKQTKTSISPTQPVEGVFGFTALKPAVLIRHLPYTGCDVNVGCIVQSGPSLPVDPSIERSGTGLLNKLNVFFLFFCLSQQLLSEKNSDQ